MAKDKSIYTCTECGGSSPKWQGKCPHCEAWNTLVEGVAEAPQKNRYQSLAKTQPVATLGEIEASDVDRQATGIDELDRVLGGGIVAGGVVLIGGDLPHHPAAADFGHRAAPEDGLVDSRRGRAGGAAA